ncbi:MULTISPECIES: RodZ family helix-turn-helix domain-containing protein [unclassified Treponema]|uniref:helix-turn-helix domain-containing protein n=1 Tax=unclassified Treponema TaxID=2638727 RepID=UPI0020A5C78F|nr:MULTISPECIES: helix-turn-helix domain-containing protein [unclassified Treponema]UTC66379.1 helix-turn-helix domain-containing protein [Treponema sp. OMZ 789]UTC69109.1 helix-turn-helix domain-containing protein [Treponema sp. OMZ 790]UTC71821.1 helix-turn-helix domain-containing protein [Treponema sp. OMZ 791]
MNEIGKLLTETRTNRELELDQVARETNIAKRYLEALENDDYSVFPAEPYVLGFLRNYCEYLDLNPEEIINLYKQIKIQETSLPPDALLEKRSFSISKPLVIGLGALAAIAVIITLIFFAVKSWIPAMQQRREQENSQAEIRTVREAKIHEINQQKYEQRIFEGDSLKLNIDGKEFNIEVEKISPKLNLKTGTGTQIISLGQTVKMDLNNDLTADLEITVEDIDKNNSEAGALVSILTGSNVAQGTSSAGTDLVVSETGTPVSSASKVLFESGSAYPVTLNATFRGYCLFRHEADRTNREEKYYQKAEQLTVQANNGLRIWASNGNAVKLQVVAGGKTVDLEVSRPGEVIVKDLKWIRDDETKRFKFIVVDVD